MFMMNLIQVLPLHLPISLCHIFLPLMMASTDMDENDCNYYLAKDSATSLLEVWKKGQQQLNSLWDIWRNKYLLRLRVKSPMYHRSQKNHTSSWSSCYYQR